MPAPCMSSPRALSHWLCLAAATLAAPACDAPEHKPPTTAAKPEPAAATLGACAPPDAAAAGPFTEHQDELLERWDASTLPIEIQVELHSELPPLDPSWHEVDDATRARWRQERTEAYAPSRAPVLQALACVGDELLDAAYEVNVLSIRLIGARAREVLWQPNVRGWSGESIEGGR